MTASERGNLLLLSESYHNAAMYYAIGFLFVDAVIYLRHAAGEVLVCSNFEREEAARHSKIRHVITQDDLGYLELARQEPDPHRIYADIVLRLLQRYGVHDVTVAPATPLHVVDHLRAGGISVTCDPAVLEGARMIKNADEIAAIETAQRATDQAMQRAIEIVAGSEPRDGVLVYDGTVLTSERLRANVDMALLDQGCYGEGTIIACATDAASPHNRGAGPLRPNQPIVMDLFPRHRELRYFADMTRTVSKGDPGPEVRRMYDVTLRAQELALSLIRPQANGREIYEAVCRLYEEAGYATSLRDGSFPASGFIHGLGHGVGLEIHERPSLNRTDCTLEAGHVVTVEPGLYDARSGGVRIEDLVVVTEHGCRDLTRGEKRLVY
jgi:Xaa-Pro aminopeptidase